MLFNSLHFLFFFLPVSLLLFFIVGRTSARAAKIVLAVLSLVFYAYWDYRFLPLLLGSIGINYAIGMAIMLCDRYGYYVAQRRV